ncbi:hypothetical protein EVJ58_g6438 [Rhodofomes roseus]|uniref:Uncharacterized protein n=1 Tax=Rhodofomes roseus TaxID=34475 RepID=A0A4Y9Y942_9APHY|nr:hypothetical protein EVJ58_g6438 [Rhodofomes roseus]
MTQLARAADVLAAVKAGKLPSEEQLIHALQLLLRSTVLNPDSEVTDYGALSDIGREAITDVRRAVEAIIQFGLEKNVDDKIQDFLYQCRIMDSVPVRADIAVDADRMSEEVEQVVQELPSADEARHDAEDILNSLRYLLRVTVTSRAFRALLSDVWLTAKDMLADVARDVSQIASQVQSTADEVEHSIRPTDSLGRTRGKARDAGDEDIQVANQDTLTGNLDRVQETVLARAREIIRRAHNDPSLHRALQTILVLLRKYASKAGRTSDALSDTELPTVTPVVWADPPLAGALDDLKVLLERTASGHSLDLVLHCLSLVATDVAHLPADVIHDDGGRRELGQYFGRLSAWLDNALSDSQYAFSSEGQQDASRLYASGRELIQRASESHAEWLDHTRSLMETLDAFVSAIQSDRTTQRLMQSFDALSADFSRLISVTAIEGPAQVRETRRTWRQQLQRDVLVWLVPRVLRVVKAIPMPRVEYTSPSLDAAVDALLVSASGAGTSASASLVPDHIRVANYSEIQVRVDDEGLSGARSRVPASGGASAYTRTRIHADGIRVAARDISYYAHYKGWRDLIGYEDQGLFSIDVGERQARGQGLSFDVELEFDGVFEDGRVASHTTVPETDTTSESKDSLFRVTDVKVDVPGLHFSIDRSKHWILNKMLLQPLAGPVVRTAASYVLSQQIRTALETLGRLGARVKRKAGELSDAQKSGARDTSAPSLESYWQAILQEVGGPMSNEDRSSGEEGGSEHVETHTTATLKGVVHTTVTHPPPGASRSQMPDETVLAVGVAPQILLGKGGPVEGPSKDEYGTRDMAREALSEVQGRAEHVEGNLQEAVEATVQVREQVNEAAYSAQITERVEKGTMGWRSHVFDV